MNKQLLKKDIVDRVVEKLWTEGKRIEISNQKYIYNKYRLKYTQKVVNNVINAFWGIIADVLAEGDSVKLKEELNNIEPIETAEKVLTDYWTREHIKVEHTASNEAYYSPSRDLIHLPLFEQFKTASEYYSTAFHESVHSTMKESRCNREEERK